MTLKFEDQCVSALPPNLLDQCAELIDEVPGRRAWLEHRDASVRPAFHAMAAPGPGRISGFRWATVLLTIGRHDPKYGHWHSSCVDG